MLVQGVGWLTEELQAVTLPMQGRPEEPASEGGVASEGARASALEEGSSLWARFDSEVCQRRNIQSNQM